MNQTYTPWLPSLLGTRCLGIQFMLEASRRESRRGAAWASKHLMEASRIDGGYCIDAPDVIPAGGCVWAECEPDDSPGPHGVADQLTVER